MRKISVVLAMLLGGMPMTTLAAPVPSQSAVKITEVYMGSPLAATDEYIVITNTGSAPLELKGVAVEYKSATGKSWVKKGEITESHLLAPYADVIFAVTRPHDFPWISGMAQLSGNLRVVDSQNKVLDQVAWGTGDSPESNDAVAPKAGEALVRICDEATKTCQDTDNNAADFQVTRVESMASATSAMQMAAADPTGDESAELEITELLPDPVSPQTDAKDEFVELYNGGSMGVNLSGWKLVDTSGHAAKLNGNIAPGGYLALYASQTKLSLNNTGDTVSLVSPSGTVLMTTPNFGKAKPGKAFGATPSGWGWLEIATPGGPNAALSADQADATVTSKKTTSSRVKSTTAKAVRKTSTAKTKAPALAKAVATKDTKPLDGVANEDSTTVPWPWLLAGLSAVAVGYAVYEYRPEIIGYLTKLRAKFGSRR